MISDNLLNEIKKIVGQNYVRTISRDDVENQDYQTYIKGNAHFVVEPSNANEIARLVKVCQIEKIPLTTRGGGSGLTGASVPIHGGIVLSMRRLNHILDIDLENMTVCCEAGVITETLQTTLIEKGLYFPTDPTSKGLSQIGGNVATNAGGPKAVKYGVVRDYVLNLEVVLADGSIIWTGSNTRKNSSGYSLTHLMIGSEGTLGIITKVQLKLIPYPSHRILMAAFFDDLTIASDMVHQLFQTGIQPSCVELIDRDAYALSCAYLGLNPKRKQDQLLIELDGNDPEILWKQCRTIYTLIETQSKHDIQVAEDLLGQSLLWNIRHNISPAIKTFEQVLKADIVVPRNQMSLCIQYTKELIQSQNCQLYCFGHAGDGNLHFNFVNPMTSYPEWLEEMELILNSVYQKVIQVGGAISGEHGIGILQKKHFKEHTNETVWQILTYIKKSLDPNCILNPGKII